MDQKVHQGGQLFGRILSPQTLTRWKEHGESRSELFANAAQVYNSRVKDPVNPLSVNKDCGLLGIAPRNFYIKNKVASCTTTSTGRARFSMEALNSEQVLRQYEGAEQDLPSLWRR